MTTQLEPRPAVGLLSSLPDMHRLATRSLAPHKQKEGEPRTKVVHMEIRLVASDTLLFTCHTHNCNKEPRPT